MENFAFGLELLIIGLGTVFLSLYLLSVFLYFSGKILGPKEMRKKVPLKEQRENNEPELDGLRRKKAAAITAAVYQMLSDKKSYRIISIKKRNQNWKR
ncbi:OadG family protein [Halanaerobium hydrogeniformans]|uniref:Sodium pump decarboxylase gamma subunit n=1 Tax=Halanaerobium hydrogeniformans TaxID=656519 RepID=E4RJR6_HALHG|nr:OadG family protein [Halanaerobium hydrogeniformans]ADQ15486.1 sodium pump decarboxylase gamma subunit [Halanaerobium hydrogeniformans]